MMNTEIGETMDTETVDPFARPYEVTHTVVTVPPPVLCPSGVATVLCGMMRVTGVTMFVGRPTPTTFDFYNWSGKIWEKVNDGEERI